jgi:hypothetical protein
MFVKPSRKGLIVRFPGNGKPLNEDGEHVPSNTYWARRLRDRDVVEAKPPTKKTRTPAKQRRETVPVTPEDSE